MPCEQNLHHKRRKVHIGRVYGENLVIIYSAIGAIISFAVRAILFFC
jgi:hypothetical protein